MMEEVRRKCMEPFFTTKSEQRGMGLGLAMVHGVVQRHNGYVHIASEPGKGSTFEIRLPAGEPAAQAETVEPSGDNASTGFRLLAVDDDPLVLDTIAETLRSRGHTVETALSGREALEKFRVGEFDAVLTDLAMPGINGDRVASAIKQVAPDMPVILLTGFGEMMETAGTKPPDIDLIVPKPFTEDSLHRAVTEVVLA